MRMKPVPTASTAAAILAACAGDHGPKEIGGAVNSGHSGSTTPTRTYDTGQGPCREYTTSVAIDGKTQSAHGTPCREPDGTWRIES